MCSTTLTSIHIEKAISGQVYTALGTYHVQAIVVMLEKYIEVSTYASTLQPI
jgi:hypothetical protein